MFVTYVPVVHKLMSVNISDTIYTLTDTYIHRERERESKCGKILKFGPDEGYMRVHCFIFATFL